MEVRRHPPAGDFIREGRAPARPRWEGITGGSRSCATAMGRNHGRVATCCDRMECRFKCTTRPQGISFSGGRTKTNRTSRTTKTCQSREGRAPARPHGMPLSFGFQVVWHPRLIMGIFYGFSSHNCLSALRSFGTCDPSQQTLDPATQSQLPFGFDVVWYLLTICTTPNPRSGHNCLSALMSFCTG